MKKSLRLEQAVVSARKMITDIEHALMKNCRTWVANFRNGAAAVMVTRQTDRARKTADNTSPMENCVMPSHRTRSAWIKLEQPPQPAGIIDLWRYGRVAIYNAIVGGACLGRWIDMHCLLFRTLDGQPDCHAGIVLEPGMCNVLFARIKHG